jgi:Ca2+-binding EF-hand superfamily protein
VEAWKQADKDGDGFLSKEEFEAMPRIASLPEEKRPRVFKRLDKNNDGRLGRVELSRMGLPHDGQGPPMQRLWELDLDKSGGVSFDEFKTGEFYQKLPPERQEDIFRKLDTNRDGMLSPKDKPQPPFKHEGGKPPPPRRPKEPGGKHQGPHNDSKRIFQQLDKNGDGCLSFDEFRVGPRVDDLSEDEREDHFEGMNNNHDQKLTPDEPAPPSIRERGPKKGEMRPEEGRPSAPEPDR